MSTIRLNFFGAFEATVNHKAVTGFATDKVRGLLAYLATEMGQPHRREVLANLLWSEMAQSAAMTNLRLALHRLRAAFDKIEAGVGLRLVESTRQTLQLQQESVIVDVIEFVRLLAECTQHDHRDIHHCAECRTRMMRAADLYRGELLIGFSLSDAPAFEEWLLLLRERLHQQAIVTLSTLVQIHEQLGDLTRAHQYASRQLALDPSREEAHQQLMRNLMRRGLRKEALAHYELCRQILQEELGVPPSAETLALHQRMLADESASTPANRMPLGRVEVPEVSSLFGRERELAQLHQWLAEQQSRLVFLLGIGGIGKTTLAATAAQANSGAFDRVIWRSLLNAQPLDELLRDVLQRLSNERLTDAPRGLDAQVTLLLKYLHQQRVLLILDNLESILQPDQPGTPLPTYSSYTYLVQQIAQYPHRSSVLITSREQLQEMRRWEGETPHIQVMSLAGLDQTAGHAVLSARGIHSQLADSATLVKRYSGNPLALKLVAQTVHELFEGDIGAFLATETPIFDDIRTVLDQQFARLTPLEQEILIWLAIERETIHVQELRENIVGLESGPRFLESLRALQRRSLIGQSPAGFALQNVIIEYLTEKLIGEVYQEIVTGWWDGPAHQAPGSGAARQAILSSSLNRFALLKATARAHVSASQVRLILEPVASRLTTRISQTEVVARLTGIVADLQAHTSAIPGYAAGNVLNLLLHMGINVHGMDFSRLCVWQVQMQGKLLPEVNFRKANLARSVFTHRFGEVKDIQFDAQGDLLITGSVAGQLHLWRVQGVPANEQLLHEYHSFGSDATRADFSMDGVILASGHTDRCIRLWDVVSGQLLQTLSGHIEVPWSVTFSPDNTLLASGTADGMIYLWDKVSGQVIRTLKGHSTAIPALAFAQDGQHFASGDVNGGVCIWRIDASEPVYRLQGHTDEVHALTFAANGSLLVTTSHDRSVRVWDIHTGKQRYLLQGHNLPLRAVAVSPNGFTLATGGDDSFVYLWDLQTGQIKHLLSDLPYCINYLKFSLDGQRLASVGIDQSIHIWNVETAQRLDHMAAYSSEVFALAVTGDGKTLASAGADQIIRLWDTTTEETRIPNATLHGHMRRIVALSFSPSGNLLASAGNEPHICLWHVPTRRLLHTLEGHTNHVEDVRFSPDSRYLASTSRDKTIRIWALDLHNELKMPVSTRTLSGHTERIRVCAFSPDSRHLASGGMDRTIRLWKLDPDSACTHVLTGHTNGVRCVAFSPDGRLLVSGSYDQTLRFWDVATGQPLAVWTMQNTIIFSVAIHPNGKLLAIGSGDNHVDLWDIDTGRLLAKLPGHTASVEAICFSQDGLHLFSGSWDETVKHWDVATALAEHSTCLKTLRAEGPYAGMDITGVIGISAAQKAALRELGAIDGHPLSME